MALINCLKCGKEISDQANWCPSCGTQVKVPQKQWNTPISCSECGKEILSQVKYCPNCGAPVNTPEKQPNKPETPALGIIAAGLGFAVVIAIFIA